VDRRVRKHRIGDRGRSDRSREELLDVGRIGRVLTAADDVPERNREIAAAERAAEMLIQRRTEYVRGRLRGRHRDRNGAVGADLGEVLGSVGTPECVVDAALVAGVDLPFEPWNGDLSRRCDRLSSRSFDGLVLACRRSRRRGTTSEAAAFGADLGLDGRVPATVEDPPEADFGDERHLSPRRTVNGSASASYSSAATRIGSVWSVSMSTGAP